LSLVIISSLASVPFLNSAKGRPKMSEKDIKFGVQTLFQLRGNLIIYKLTRITNI